MTDAQPDADLPFEPTELAEFGLDRHDVAPEVSLRSVLRSAGVEEAEIDRAEAEGTVELLAIEHLVLPEEPRYDLAQVAEAAGVEPQHIAQLWRALGFPDPRPGQAIFTDVDLDLMHTVAGLLEMGVADTDLVVQMARVIGSSMARIAGAQVDAFELRDPTERTTADDSFALHAGALLPTMPKVMDYVWRRHLRVAAERRMVRLADAAERGEDRLTVGFADLVGFTALSQQVSAHELASIVDRFETVAYETVTRLGGRVVKMIGDEVMFTIPDVRQAVEIALTLATAYHDDESLSDVRVGLAYGPVLEREADCYGPVVNLASRIVGIAFPGSVVVSDEIHDELGDDGSFAWRSLRYRTLKDIGRVRLWAARWPDEDAELSRRDKARARRAERREVVVERLADLEEAARSSRAEPVKDR